MNLQPVLLRFGFPPESAQVQPYGSGLINHTWKLCAGGTEAILQRINTAVFKDPQGIARNLQLLADFLKKTHPDYLFVAPLPAADGRTLVHTGEGWFRLLPFVAGAHAADVVQTPRQAFEAAAQFGRFTRLLAPFEAAQLSVTIPHFHNLSLRYHQFQAAIKQGMRDRRHEAAHLIELLSGYAALVAEYEAICTDPAFRRRVTHHDTKISNVLFDAGGKGLCVVDLDTVMPGLFISDVGDMMRTYLPAVSEEEEDTALVTVREEIFRAIIAGYLQEMGPELTAAERRAFLFAGRFMTYMQALRFLTDFLCGDVYYGASYAGHNKVRAANQAALLQRLMEMKAHTF